MRRCGKIRMNYCNANPQIASLGAWTTDDWDNYKEFEILKLLSELNGDGTYLSSLPAAPPVTTSDNSNRQQINNLYLEGGDSCESLPTSTSFQSSPSNEVDHNLIRHTEDRHALPVHNRHHCTFQGCAKNYCTITTLSSSRITRCVN